MAIVGDHPESGVRFALERPLRGGPPWVYEGHAFTPAERFPVQVRVSEGVEVEVTLGDEAPAGMAEKVRLLFRSLYKQARGEGEKQGGDGEPPRKVVRWRGEK